MYFRLITCQGNGALGYLLGDVAAGEAAREWPRLARLAAELGADEVIAGDSPLAGADRAGDGASIVFGDQVIHVLATPGHTPGSLSFLWHDRVFCGDLLDAPANGGHAWASDPGKLYDSVTGKLFRLPDETLVFPGHRQRGRTVSTIADERARHPEFGAGGRDAYVAVSLARRMARRGAGSRRKVRVASDGR